MKNFLTITAEFNLKDKMTFYALDSTNHMVGTLIIEDEEIKYYNKQTEETTSYGDDVLEFEQFVFAHDLHFHKASDSQFVKYQPNPQQNKTGDCSIRAYCKAEGMEWDDAYDIAVKYGKTCAALPDDANVVDTILTQEFGYSGEKLKKDKKVTVNEFCLANPTGTFILSMRGHVVTVVDGKYYDSWDSGKKKVNKVYSKSVVE